MYISSISYTPVQNKQNNVSFQGKFPTGEIKPKHIKPLFAYRDFARYNPKVKDFGSYKIPVHNEDIANRLKPTYTSKEFKELFDYTKKKGTFDFMMDPKTGFIKTSMINRKENVLMSDMIWITDTSHNIDLLKAKSPEKCTQAINTISKLYDREQPMFDAVIANPEKYRKNGAHVWQGQTGVGHCFDPKTQTPHKWFAKTRLESIGNYISTTTDLIKTGFNGGKYGYKNVDEIPETVVKSIPNTVKYLKAIDYPNARSCGNWEEQTFDASLTSDTSIINQAMRNIMDLMYSKTEDKNLLKLRSKIMNTKHGDVFKDKQGLENLLKRGEERIALYPDREVPDRIDARKIKETRKYDVAMSYMPQSEKVDKNNFEHDMAKKLLIMKKVDKALTRPNGAIRYQGDEYLNLDYHTIKNHWTDGKKKNEAEWFLVSEMASGYGAIAKDLLDHIEKNGANKKTRRLLDIAMNAQTEHINRSYARITPKHMTKSNFYSCPAYKLPEAYEAVTTKNGKVKYVPGAHNPLTWAESSLYKASENYISNLERYEGVKGKGVNE